MEHKYQCNNVRYLMDYFINLGISDSQLLKGVKAEKSFIYDSHNWLPVEDLHQIMKNCQEFSPYLTLDDWQEIAHNIKDAETTGIWKTITKFIGIRSFYSLVPTYSKRFSTYLDLKINAITNTSVDYLIKSDPNVRTYFMVRWTTGGLQFFPRTLGLPTAKAQILFDQCKLRSIITELYKKYGIDYKEENDIVYANGKPLGKMIRLKHNIENGRNVFTDDYSYKQPYNAIRIIDNLIINDRCLLKKGDIFDAPCSRIILTWTKKEKKLSHRNSKKIKKELLLSFNEHISLVEERYFESERLRKKEEDKNYYLKKTLNILKKKEKTLEDYWGEKDNKKFNIEKDIVLKMKKNVEPTINKLNCNEFNEPQKKIVEQLKQKFNDMVTPMSKYMKFNDYSFTPSETQIAKLIQNGKRSKEISTSLNISLRTVETHRRNIRKKLNLSNKDINLMSYLMSLK